MTTEESPLSVSTTSLLDKPLHQLTEDDISQLTREDCRRYLKQKGMRRPSWNKSQAIQQVIMLKALLEPKPESDGCNRTLHITHRREETATTRVQKGTSADTEVSVSADESVAGQLNDFDQSDLPGDNEFVRPGIAGVTDEAKGQMTIFYSGMVNVYDGVSAEKAWTLLQFAAIPLQFSQEAPFDENVTTHPLTCHLQAPNIKSRSDSSAMFLPTLQTVKMTDNFRLHREDSSIFREDNSAAEGSASRKASVQRYLEKRKDRYKSKRKATCGSLDELSHQIQNQNHQNEQSSSRSYTCSPPPVRPPHTPNRFS